MAESGTIRVHDDPRKPRFAQIPEWILFSPNLSDRAVRLYSILTRIGNGSDTREVKRSTLAQRLRCSESSIDRALRELVEDGAVWTEPCFANGHRSNTAYFLAWDQPEQSSASLVTRSKRVTGDDTRLREENQPGEELTTGEPVVISPERPRSPLQIEHQLLFEALCEATQVCIQELTPVRGKTLNGMTKTLRQRGADPPEVLRRAQNHFTVPSPEYLVGHWAELGQDRNVRRPVVGGRRDPVMESLQRAANLQVQP